MAETTGYFINEFQDEWNDSFQFNFTEPHGLSAAEKAIYDTLPKIVALIGGLPANVKKIRISETMRMETYAFVEAAGLWEPSTGSIIIKRSQLRTIEEFAGTLLHEIAHARSGAPDISSDFEKTLTELLGKTGSQIGDNRSKRGFLSKLFST